MKAIAKCPKCGETLTTDCEACIENKNALHCCNGNEQEVIENIDWKLVPETERELLEVEEIK